MLNTERISTMIQLYRFEEGPKKEYLKIHGMFRSDYIGMALLKNFLSITIGYALIIGVLVLYNLEELMMYWFEMDLKGIAADVLKGYLILLVLYSLVTYIVCSIHYFKMKKYIKEYDSKLEELENQYDENARREDI